MVFLMIGLLFSPFQLSLAASIQKTRGLIDSLVPLKIIIIDAGHGGTDPGVLNKEFRKRY